MRENDFLSGLAHLFAPADPGVIVGCGPDDCAHVRPAGPQLAFSVDAFTEGAHFTSGTPAADIARKSVGASLSDLAASACRARWLLVTLCLGPGTGGTWAEEFAKAVSSVSTEWNVAVIGGDTTSSPLATTVTVTAVGEPLPGGPIFRSGARPGDVLAVTGRLGGSIRGRHLRPVPRLREMAWLMERCPPHAGMDISDGLAMDLSRLCRESGVGAVLDAAEIPIARAAREQAKGSGQSPLSHALNDGEDFELLVAMSEDAWGVYAAAWKSQEEKQGEEAGTPQFTRVGAVTRETGLFLRQSDGSLEPLPPGGYEHQW